MYSHHFGLTQDPFSIAPDPRYLFMSERHREALAHLLYGVAGPHGAAGGTGGGFVLLTGEIGTGKTTICRCFLEQIPPGCHVAYIFNPKLSVTELLQSICEEFHIALALDAAKEPTLKHHIDALNAFLLHSHAAGQSCVLIIDEAQNLTLDVLEQLRLLTNLETNERKLLQIVLIGQPELRQMLARPELEQLAQRVVARFHLDTLTDAETTQYIAHRLAVAGHSGPLPFDQPALQRIHQLAHGVPRRINLLCGRALLGAWAHGLDHADRAVVDKAAAEVFGHDGAPVAPSPGPRYTAYALGGVLLLAASALTGFLEGRSQPQDPASPRTAAPAQPARAAASAASSRPAGASLPPAPSGAALQAGLAGTSQAGASAPQAGSSAPGRAERPAAAAELQALLPRLPQDMDAAWRELATVWQLPVSQGDPCEAASAQQLHCYRTAILTMPLLRQLGRPGILTLQSGNGAPVYALLVGLSEQTATLRLAGQLHQVRLAALGQRWRGDFATYWRRPAGYSASLRPGSGGPVIQRLASQLSQLDGLPAPDPAQPQVLDEALRARVRAFQLTHGLQPDGQPGPMTLMQIDSATGVDGPRLRTDQR